ncbi:MAG TPA: divalent-cation tolerance protein CutA [bacterium]|nr:divalent-cation tolerance protein CutA [bacterium]HOM27757.1 divalent-cation tolerance protein CutA [bacterium]
MKFIQIITTSPDKKNCEKIVKELLEEKVVSCCQIIGPVESHYWWEKRIEKSKEWLIFIKCKKKNYKKVEKKIKEIHPYKVPEIISFEISDLSEEYMDYLSEM